MEVARPTTRMGPGSRLWPVAYRFEEERIMSVAEESNEFALALSGPLLERPGNLFYSPFSIRAALCMAYAGARGETAAQMRRALSISSSEETLHVAFAEILQHLNAAVVGGYEMTVANSLWGQRGTPLREEFVDLIARHYNGGMNLVDFRSAAESARLAINQWVEDRTGHKILDLIPPGGLNADARLVPVNAAHFKGAWVFPFPRSATRQEPFYLDNGGNVPVPLMFQQCDKVRYMQAAEYQAVELLYWGFLVSMVVILPDRNVGLRNFEKTLSTQMFRDCVAEMNSREVKLFLPRFKITWGTVNMRSLLEELGMSLAFTQFRADFSGINGCEPPAEESLFLSAVWHKAFVEVHEEGTEAAAATAIGMLAGGAHRPITPPPVPVFRADHPFLFAIRDRKSGAILFLGRIADPTRES